MDFETIKALALPLIGALCVVVWWLIREVITKVDKAHTDLAEFKLVVAEKYVNHSDLGEAMNGIREVLGGMSRQIFSLTEDFKEFSVRVFDKLDRKADKV